MPAVLSQGGDSEDFDERPSPTKLSWKYAVVLRLEIKLFSGKRGQRYLIMVYLMFMVLGKKINKIYQTGLFFPLILYSLFPCSFYLPLSLSFSL